MRRQWERQENTAGAIRRGALLSVAVLALCLSAGAQTPPASQPQPAKPVTVAPDKTATPGKAEKKTDGKAVGRETNLAAPRTDRATISPALAATFQGQGDSFLRSGNRSAAAAAYARAAESSPRDPLLRLALGVMLAEQGMVKQALPNFRKAVEFAEDDVVAAFLLRSALADTGAGPEAQEIYLDTVRRFSRPGKPGLDTSRSVARLSGALKQYPASPVYYLLLGDAYQLAEQWKQADDAYQKAILVAPTWTKPRINLGLSRLAQGRSEDAIKTFEEALKVEPRNAFAQLGKGEAQWQAGQSSAANRTFQQVMSNRAASQNVKAQAMTRAGQAYFSAGEPDKALNYLNQARKADPNDPAPSVIIGNIQENSGNYAAASSAYATALRLTREGGLFPNPAQLYRLLAEAQLSARQPQRARETLQQALAEQPGSAPLWHRLMARVHEELKQPEQARSAYRAALDSEQEAYPLDTLTAIRQAGLLDTFATQYKQELIAAESGVAVQRGVGESGSGGNGVTLRMTGPAERGPARRIPALVALAHIARYRNEFSEEVRLRTELTKLRNNAWDWFLMAETYDLRLVNPANARAAYLRAIEIGGLNDVATAFARQRLERLTAPAYKP
jgi:tetratricopeptide (TPR) repeat protein